MTGFPDPNDPAYMDTPDVGEHPIEDTTPSPFVQGFDRYVAGTPERLAQRDRECDIADIQEFLDKYGRANTSGERHEHRLAALARAHEAARLIAAHVRVGREDEAHAAGRLEGYEDGTAVRSVEDYRLGFADGYARAGGDTHIHLPSDFTAGETGPDERADWWRIRSLVEIAFAPMRWEVVATDGNRVVRAEGHSPAAALNALARRLRAGEG